MLTGKGAGSRHPHTTSIPAVPGPRPAAPRGLTGAPPGAWPLAQQTLAEEGEANLACGSDWDPVLTVLVIHPFLILVYFFTQTSSD